MRTGVVMLIASGIVVVVALIGLVVGLRGRRIDDHPRCRKCGFDVVGLYPAAVTCPECGRGLSGGARGRGGVRIGNRRRRRGLIAVSVVALVVSLVVGGVVAWGASASGAGLVARKPVWWLILDARSGNLVTQDRALKELVKRRDQKRLTEEQFLRLVREGLAIQADEQRIWNRAWGDFIEVAWLDGLLTAEQKKSYAANAYGVRVTARQVVRRGDRVPASVEISMRAGSGSFFAFDITLSEMAIGGQKLLSLPFFAAGSLDGGSGSVTGMFSSDDQFRGRDESPTLESERDALVAVDPGSYELKTRWKVKVGLVPSDRRGMSGWTYGRSYSRSMFPREVENPEGEREIEIITPVRVVEAGTETVELVKDERLAAAVRSAIRVRIDDKNEDMFFGTPGRYARIEVRDPPIDVAFDITVRGPSREDRGQIIETADQKWVVPFMGTRAQVLLKGGEEEGTYDITLTPSVEMARATTGMTRIWGEPITFTGVAPEADVDAIDERASEFRVVASLKIPPGHLSPGNHAFRSVALRMPYVYVGDRLGDLYLFRVDEEDRKSSKDPVAIVERVGDGSDLKVVGDVLLCTKGGGLAVYSLKEPERPELLVEVGVDETRSSESLVVDGEKALVLGGGSIAVFDIADPARPVKVEMVDVLPRWVRAGCIEGGYLYTAEMGGGSGGEESGPGVGVYDLSVGMRRVGFVGTRGLAARCMRWVGEGSSWRWMGRGRCR